MEKAAAAADRMHLVMTRSYPGGWVKGKDPAKILAKLKGDWRSYIEDYGYALFSVHPETYMDDMGSFVFPKDNPPVKIKEVSGRKK